MDQLQIGDRPVGRSQPTFVVAEAGNNHNGDFDTAKQLVEVAAEAGADAVKFQTGRAERTYVENSGGVDYLDEDKSIYETVKELEMPYEWIPELADYADEQGIVFLSTPFDERSTDELDPYVPAYKIASYTMSHHLFLEYVASKDKPVVLSTGTHTLEEVREAVSVLREAGQENIVLLQCVAAYPTPLEGINVRVVETLREEFDVPSGLSDHTTHPSAAPAAAAALGAAVVEKHFTLDKSMEGPDHEFALEPDELERMVTAIRNTDAALGTPEKKIYDAERELYDFARRGIQASRDIESGEEITEDAVSVLRAGKRQRGLEPKYFDDVIGSTAASPVPKWDGIDWDDLE
jgi:N-acetylneuraminate synthase